MKRTLRELRTYCYSIKTIWRRSTRRSSSMGKQNTTVECVTKKLFVHTNIMKSTCKECGGGGVCPHKKRKLNCKECAGCPHGKHKCYC